MMQASSAIGEMRVLSDAEIAMVAGGPGGDTVGITLLINNNSIMYLTDDHAFMESNGYVFADYSQNGAYDSVWRTAAGGCEQSFDGIHWFRGTNPADEMIDWAMSHHTWLDVDGG